MGKMIRTLKMTKISSRTTAQLVDYVNHGNAPKYMLFWGHRKSKTKVTKSCFSQWYEAGFEHEGVYYQRV